MTWTLIIILISNSSIKPASVTTTDFGLEARCIEAAKVVQDIHKEDDRVTIITRCVKK